MEREAKAKVAASDWEADLFNFLLRYLSSSGFCPHASSMDNFTYHAAFIHMSIHSTMKNPLQRPLLKIYLGTYCGGCGGLSMIRSRGRIWMKTRLTQGAITWVCGDRKWMFSTTTVTHMLQ